MEQSFTSLAGLLTSFSASPSCTLGEIFRVTITVSQLCLHTSSMSSLSTEKNIFSHKYQGIRKMNERNSQYYCLSVLKTKCPHTCTIILALQLLLLLYHPSVGAPTFCFFQYVLYQHYQHYKTVSTLCTAIQGKAGKVPMS